MQISASSQSARARWLVVPVVCLWLHNAVAHAQAAPAPSEDENRADETEEDATQAEADVAPPAEADDEGAATGLNDDSSALPEAVAEPPPVDDDGIGFVPVEPELPPDDAEPGFTPAPYYPSPRPSSGVNRRYAYGTPIRRWTREPGPGAREHEGLFLRLSMGFGAALNTYREAVNGRTIQDVETRGLAFLFDLAVGGRIWGNLIAHGNVWANDIGPAKKRVDDAQDASNRIETSMAMLGVGLTYYFMPANAYVTGVIGAGAIAEQRDDDVTVGTDTGLGLATMLGKEWWVGPRAEWALGAALRASFFRAVTGEGELANLRSTMRGGDLGIVFSVTYN